MISATWIHCFQHMLVLSKLYGCTVSTSHRFFTCGTAFKSSSDVIAGVRPFSVFAEAMVPPVAMNRIFFILHFPLFFVKLRKYHTTFPRINASRRTDKKETSRSSPLYFCEII